MPPHLATPPCLAPPVPHEPPPRGFRVTPHLPLTSTGHGPGRERVGGAHRGSHTSSVSPAVPVHHPDMWDRVPEPRRLDRNDPIQPRQVIHHQHRPRRRLDQQRRVIAVCVSIGTKPRRSTRPGSARPDTQTSFAEINPVNYRQYWAAPPVRAGKCQEL
jgi:hypothetical protein